MLGDLTRHFPSSQFGLVHRLNGCHGMVRLLKLNKRKAFSLLGSMISRHVHIQYSPMLFEYTSQLALSELAS